MRKLETIIYIKDCPKLIEDKADSTLMIHSTCQSCEYYKGSSLYLITITCDYPNTKPRAQVGIDAKTDAEEKKFTRVGDMITIPCKGCSIKPPFSWKTCLQCQREGTENEEETP